MPDRDQLYQALRNADAAGDVEGAKKLAAYIQTIGSAPVISPVTQLSTGDRILADLKQAGSENGKVTQGIGEAALNMASGLGSSVVGGFRGLASLATGGSLDDAAKAVQDTQQAGTYQPRTGIGKVLTDAAGLPMEAAKAVTAKAGEGYGMLYDLAKNGGVNGTDARQGQGAIAGRAIGNVAPDIAAALYSGRAALKAAPSIESVLADKTAALRERMRGSAAAFNDEDAAALAGEPMPESAPEPTSGLQSASAAAADHLNMAAAGGASPEIQSVIQQAGNNVHPVAAARHTEASSLPVPVELTAGQASDNAALISAEKNNRGKYPELAETFNRQNDQLIQNFDEIRSRVAPDVSARGVDLGQMAVDAYKDMDAPIRADITAKYKALEDANGGQFPLSGKDFVAAADEALKKANRTRFVPGEVQGILGDLRDGGPMTFADFEEYRTILAEQARKAERAGDGTASYAVSLVRNALEELPMTNEAAAIKPLADAARSAAKERFDRIKADPAYKAAINDGVASGEPSPLADKFIQDYVVKGKTANVQRLVQNLSNDPLNQQIIAAGVVDHLKHVSGIDLRTNTGNVSQSGLNSAINTLDKKTPLILGPEAATTINTLGNVAGYTMKQSKGSFVNNSNTTTSALAQGGKDMALGALDAKTMGATKFLRGVLDKRALDKSVQKSIEPGAGIDYSTFPSLKAEMERNAPAKSPIEQSRLDAYIAAAKQRKALDDLSRAQSVDEAIKAVSDQ